jgi:protein PhnA
VSLDTAGLNALHARSSACELCAGGSDLAGFEVTPARRGGADDQVLICGNCADQLGADELDPKRWFGLKEAAWSAVPSVQALSWRLLNRLSAEDWAQDLLGTIYLEQDTLAWAQAGTADTAPPTVTRDSNGNPLADGDSVTLIKDLDVKGTSFVAKRGTMVRNIRTVNDDPGNVEGRVNGVTLVLKTQFLKRAQ